MLRGAGANARSQEQWRTNRGGTRRTLEEALEIGRRNGVPIDDELFCWKMGRASDFKTGELARYAELRSLRAKQLVPRRRFISAKGQYVVLLHPAIMGSDDAILAVLIHETHEIDALEAELAANGDQLTAEGLRSLIDSEVGKLHSRAWDEADRRVLALIEEKRWP